MQTKLCDKKMSFKECELAILRSAVDHAEVKQGVAIVNTPEVKQIITIVENFLKQNTLIAYGGTAVNALLPKKDQFYKMYMSIPDYDFFSIDALNDAKKLADIYYKEGFNEVEAKAGQHHGTYKVFVNFMPVADITQIHPEIFKALSKEAIRVGGILYCPPNFLRMSMYLELSRPDGDIDRWEKVAKRLTALNENYPLISEHCSNISSQRKLSVNKIDDKLIFDTVLDTFINQNVVFFGGYAISLYSRYMNEDNKPVQPAPDFDVISESPEITVDILKRRLDDVGIKNIKILHHGAIGELISPHYQIKIGKDTIAFIYKPVACHSYNKIKLKGEEIKIATIDTMLSFYLAFLYSSRDYYDMNRIECLCQFLFDVQQKNRLKQSGILKRFSVQCYGHQETVEEMRIERSKKYEELKNKRNDIEYDEWFLRYRPSEKNSGESKSDPINDYVFIPDSHKRTRKVKKHNRNNKSAKMKLKVKLNRRKTKHTKSKKKKTRGRGGLFI